jgi:uncharacterized OsmC-like protein
MPDTVTARRNGIDVELLGGLYEEVVASAGPVTIDVTTRHRWIDGARIEITGGTITAFGETVERSEHQLRTDLPVPLGGSDTAAAPTEVLLAALTGCVVSALTEQAALEGVTIDSIEVSADTSLDVRGAFGVEGARVAVEPITLRVTITADAEPEHLEALGHASLAASPTAATISQPVPVRIEVRTA